MLKNSFRASEYYTAVVADGDGHGVTGAACGVNAGDRTVAHHGVEHTQDASGWRINSVSSRRSISVPRSETHRRLDVVFRRREGRGWLHEQLQQHLVEFTDAACNAEVTFIIRSTGSLPSPL